LTNLISDCKIVFNPCLVVLLPKKISYPFQNS
jgi:hypothetical protein